MAIANNKGGVGKTTLTVTLAHVLSARKYAKRVLVADLDSQCNASDLLLPKETYENTLYDLLSGDVDPHDCIYPTNYTNLDIIPNEEETAALEINLIKSGRYALIRDLLGGLTDEYDLVIADCPPNLLYFVYGALMASDFVIVPVLASSSKSIKGLRVMLEKIDEIRELNPELKFLRLLINNVDRRAATPKILMKSLQQTFSSKIFDTIIPTSTMFTHAEHCNKTILTYAGSSPAAKAYRELAGELLTILE